MTLPRWLGRLICRFRGHLRGRKLRSDQRDDRGLMGHVKVFECPRCGTTWVRRTRAPKVAERSRG